MAEQAPRLGELLIKLGIASRQQVTDAVGLQRTSRAKLGEVMVAAGFITRDQLESALAIQRRWATGGIFGLAMMALQPAPALAGSSSGVINIRAEIPAVSTIRLAQAHMPLPTDLRRPIDHAVITSISERSNSGAYTVTIVSDAAQSNGQPALVNPESGAAIPYRLTYGDQELHFDGDRAVLERPLGKGSQAQAIAISTQPGTGLAPGPYGDRLTIVLSAR